MALNEQDLFSLQRKVDRYKEVLQNTKRYRDSWSTSLKQTIIDQLTQLSTLAGLTGTIEVPPQVAQL